MSSPNLTSVDWTAVAELISNGFTGIMLATPWQLRLVACVEMAQDMCLRSFEQVWVSDVLADCQPVGTHVKRNAAALPLRALVEQLPGRYMTVPEDELGSFIHDVQNILLNIQLRSELMARFRGAPSPQPPGPLPGRGSPPHERVAAIFRQFHWWAEHHLSAWKEVGSDGEE